MIKINLVPLKEKKKQQEYVLVLFAIAIGVVLIAGMFWIYIQKIETKRDLSVQIKKVDEESKGYEEKINEINAFEDVQKNLDMVNKNIKDIQTVQKKVLFTLDQLASKLPDGVWFNSVTQSGKDPNSFVVDGYSFSLTSVKTFFSSLIKTDGLSKDATLELKSVAAAIGNNKQIVQFEITTKAVDATP